jgi:nucleotide-binding universal stress UspA family protein
MVRVHAEDVEKAVSLLLEIQEESKGEPKKTRYYRKILVPVDFSEYSVKAVQYAIWLAENLHGEIRLLHVYSDPLEDVPRVKQTASLEKYRQEVLENFEEQTRRDIDAFSEDLKRGILKERFTKARLHYSLVEGSPAEEVLKTAESYKPEIVIMGTGNIKDRPNYINESAGIQVITDSRFPILILPANTTYQEIDQVTVVYATDFMDSDFSSFRQLLAILCIFKVKIYCVHIENEEDNTVKKNKMVELNKLISIEYSNYDVEFHLIKSDDFIGAVHKFAEEKKANMISFTSPKRTMIYKLLNPDSLKRMIAESKNPLLIFRVGKKK